MKAILQCVPSHIYSPCGDEGWRMANGACVLSLSLGRPTRHWSLPSGLGDVKGWGQRRTDSCRPQSPSFTLQLAHIKESSNHCGDLANDVLIKRHISKRHLKRPEGEEAIRAHLYVDEREKCRQTLHQNTEGGVGGSLASPAKYALPERESKVETERERDWAGWGWRVGREKECFFLPFILFCFTQFPKRIREQINFWTKAGFLKS